MRMGHSGKGSLFISMKFGVEVGGWHSKDARAGHGVVLWSTIGKVGKVVSQEASFEVG